MPLQMRAVFTPESLNVEARTVEVTFGTDAPVKMWSWDYGEIRESLSFDPAHVRLNRLNSGAPVLDNHDAYGSVSDIVIGVVEKAWADGKKGYASLRFANSEKASGVLSLIRDGILRNVSVGYRVNKYTITRATEKAEKDLYRAVDWEPHEISLVAVPADADAQVRGEGVPKPEVEYDYNDIIHQRGRQIRALLASYPSK